MTVHGDLEPGARVGVYTIERALGSGGMASVYLARQEGRERPVALKMLLPQFAVIPVCVERFVQEARAASLLDHPHVVAVLDIGTDFERPYLAMEYLEGETLADRLSRGGRLSTAAIADVLLPILSAVAAAHAAAIIHRDLKPDNIILAPDGAGGERPVLLDFGIAKLLEGASKKGLTQVGQVVGTPYYMAPEQIRSEELDGRTDQYALGVTMYECATLVRPFRAEQSVFVLMAEILLGQPLPPSQIEPSLPAAFEALILRAMTARREDRFPSIDALARALLPFATPAIGRRWAPAFGADADAIEPVAASLPETGQRTSLVPSSSPFAFIDPTLATQPAVPLALHGGADPLTIADLRELSLFADFSDAELGAFCMAATARRFATDAILFAQGETGDACFTVVRGAVCLTREHAGVSTVLDVLGPGMFVGQDGLVDRATRSVTARAVEDTLAIELDREGLRRMLGFHDQVALRLLEQVAITGIRQLRAGTRKLARLLEARATEVKADGTEVTATTPLERLRAAVREWSVRIDER